MKFSVLILILCFQMGFVNAQTVLNGSFETNGGSCIYNVANATYSANMSNSVGFGVASQLDIIQTSCGFGAAQSGNWYVALAVDITNTQNDGFSIALSAPLVSGNSYTVNFYDRGWAPYNTNTVQVGLSTTNNAFGSLIYTTPMPTIGTWSLRTVNFVAPNNGQFLTFRTVVGSYGWTHLDNVSFSAVLPVQELSLSGIAQPNGVDSLFWIATGAESATEYEVQYLSHDGEFVPYSKVPANTSSHSYGEAVHLSQSENAMHTYRLKVTDQNGAVSYSNLVNIEQDDASGQTEFIVFPNPNEGQFSIQLSNPVIGSEKGIIRILDLTGKLIVELPATYQSIISLPDVVPGLYIVELALPDRNFRKKIWVN